jgi:hypothetical protein
MLIFYKFILYLMKFSKTLIVAALIGAMTVQDIQAVQLTA